MAQQIQQPPKTSRPITPQTIAQALRHGTLDEQKAAHDYLTTLIQKKCRNHPRLRSSRETISPDQRIQDLVQDYSEYLLKTPGALAAHQVKGEGAVIVDIKRSLNRSDKFAFGNEYGPMRRLLYQNITYALKKNPAIFTYQRTNKRWHLTADPQTDQQIAHHDYPALDLQTLLENLPALPAAPDDGRTDRTPSLTQPAELIEFLIITLRTTAQPLNNNELLDIAWKKLHPRPQIHTPDHDEQTLLNHLNYTTQPPETLPLNQLLQHALELQKQLSPRTQNVLHLYFRTHPQPSFREIARLLQISIGTISNEYNGFSALLKTYIERHELSESERAYMLEHLVKNLQADIAPTSEPALDPGEQP